MGISDILKINFSFAIGGIFLSLLATFGIASSPGIPQDTVATTLVAPLDDEEAVEFLFKEHGDDIAAVVIEPLPANNGLLVQRHEYLAKLRSLCDEHGALLIFDEVNRLGL